MNTPISDSTFAALFAAQLDAVFSAGLVVSFLYRRNGLADVPFNGVVDAYPARLSGVLPGDARVRARAADLASVGSPGAPDCLVAVSGGAVLDVISASVEFGGAGVCLQVRRHAQTVTPQVQGGPVGLALPCVTRSGRNALSNLAAGVAVFQSDNTPGLRVFNGESWVRFSEVEDL